MESLNYIYLAIITIILISNINANVGSRRFEYKYSFKPPYLAQKDGSVPFWEYGGSKFKFFTYIYVIKFVYDKIKIVFYSHLIRSNFMMYLNCALF